MSASRGWVAQNASVPPARQHACAFGHDDRGFAEADRTVIAEHYVEARVGERQPLSVTEHEWQPGRGTACVRQLRVRQIDPDDLGTERCERG